MGERLHAQSVKLRNGKGNVSGFSLVELLVVIAILAVLAAIAIPLFLNQRAKAAQAVVQSDAFNMATELTTLFFCSARKAGFKQPICATFAT